MKRTYSTPRIVNRPSFSLVGLRAMTTLRAAAETHLVDRMAQEVQIRRSEIEGRTANTMMLFQRYPANRVFTDTVPYTFIVGIAIDQPCVAPPGMVVHTIPGGEYAMFTHMGAESELGLTYRAIYGRALKALKRYPAGHDYELWHHDGFSTHPKSTIGIYVALRRQRTYRRSFMSDDASVWEGDSSQPEQDDSPYGALQTRFDDDR